MAFRFKSVSEKEVSTFKTALENSNTSKEKIQSIGSEYLLIDAKKRGKENI